MFKNYQIKWLFILTGIFVGSVLLFRPESNSEIRWWLLIDCAVKVFVPLACCWMINGYFITHKFSRMGPYTRFSLSILMGIFCSFIFSYIFYRFFDHNPLFGKDVGFQTANDLKAHFSGAFFLNLICYVVFYSTHTNTTLQNTKLEKELLEQSHLRAQLISLQQQISPHFLFNSLSTLKTIASDQPTKNYIIQLASVYRYVLNFNEKYLTPLEDELKFVNSYLYILNERFEDALHVEVMVKEEYKKLLIPSLSLQLLIENAIKHNMISPENPLYISISTNDEPSLTVENNLQLQKGSTEGTGTGLKNIMERYKLLVGRSVRISDDHGKFTVILPLLKK